MKIIPGLGTDITAIIQWRFNDYIVSSMTIMYSLDRIGSWQYDFGEYVLESPVSLPAFFP